MGRKLFAILGPVALAITLFSSSATAGAPKVDVSHASIFCHTAFGTVGFSPPMKSGNPPQTYKIKIKATFSSCAVGGAPVAMVSGQLSSSYVTTANFCAGGGLPFSATGTTTVAWKANASTPITPTKTDLSASGIFDTGVDPSFWGANYPLLQLQGIVDTGAFGGPSGNLPVVRWNLNEDFGAINTGCGVGLKTLHTGESDLEFP
jgi:hypothetical protein